VSGHRTLRCPLCLTAVALSIVFWGAILWGARCAREPHSVNESPVRIYACTYAGVNFTGTEDCRWFTRAEWAEALRGWP
jgi:hypothetical protein